MILDLGRIRNQPGDVKTNLEIGPPKTRAGRRTIPLQSEVCDALRIWLEARAHNKELAGERWQESGLAFCTAWGRPLDPRNVTTAFMRVVGKTKVDDRPIPTANFHAIRHTFATRLLEAGVHPKVVAELLGHSDVSVVLNTYSHVLPELKEQAIAAMDKHLRRSGKKEKPKVIRWVRRWPEKEKAPEGGPEDWLQ